MAAISLVIQEKPQVWVPVTINAPIDEGFSEVKIELKVELETADKVKKMFEKAAKENTSIDALLFKNTVVDWRGLGSDADTELKFNAANVKKVSNNAWFISPCAAAILSAHNGIVEALEKN